MDKINYKKVSKYWNTVESKFFNQYSLGHKIPSEKVAIYRFKKELLFLNRKGVFKGNYLDLGCGTGNFLYEWRNKFNYLVGIDLSKTMNEFAKKKCKHIKNIKIYEDTIINFERYTNKINSFSFVFTGGCLMYLNDTDIVSLFQELYKKLEKGGIIICRESITRKKRIFENSKNYTTIRRTVKEYKKLIPLEVEKNRYEINFYQNCAYNYATIISFYWKIFPFLSNKIKIFENSIVEFLFLFIPLKIYGFIKRDMVLDYFFVIKKT